MNTLILEEPGKFKFIDQPLSDELQAHEALVKVHSVGLCGTDYHAYNGKQPFFSYPRILGHELGLEVIKIGQDVDNVTVGDKCTVIPYLNATNDHAVRRGHTNCGENISVLGVHQDGGMQKMLKVPASYLHKSNKLTYDQLAIVEMLSIGCHAVNRARVSEQDTVCVIGSGPIGMGASIFARANGAKTVMMDLNESRLDFCVDQLGVDGKVVAAQEDTERQLRAHFDGDLPTVIIDATGNEKSMKGTLELVAAAGRIVFVGLFPGDFAFHDPYFHKKEITLLASRNSLPEDFDQIIKWIEEGRINIDPLITHTSNFEDAIDNFHLWLKPETGVIKGVLHVQ
ncbi:zinc-binding alcohol dehydrogenase family protein [Persicobacter psychrovividus]|uniref:Zinc-type alcohol dehydrogenase n=1 Tax=Persicobacter psychrovividus TaxID=387638 RepID=A0ABN6LGT1_9BACT|nr:zinc-type alcohol dehydrogenase [Persicobacter psychrovividus]